MEPEKKKNRNKWLELISLPIQMGVIIYGFSWFGGWLDTRYPQHAVDYHIVLLMTGVAIAMVNVVLQVNRLNK